MNSIGIISVLAVAVVSIVLVLMAVALKSRSVAFLNFMICLVAEVCVQPWSALALHPPTDEQLRLSWIMAVIGSFLLLMSIAAAIYCVIASKPKSLSKRGGPGSKRRKKRRKRKSLAELNSEATNGEEAEESDGDDRDAPSGGI
ncbi:MAG TPA: hypothetical protein VG733_16265 [Chthoniobacteraceae bacterium]|nr:hypothetical protein [Chthoniobacteraceae bacterium]